MNIFLTTEHGAGKKIAMCHGDVTVAWHSTILFAKLSSQPTELVYGALNGYLATLPSKQQDTLFIKYLEIYDRVERITETTDLFTEVQQWFHEFFEQFNIADMRTWLLTNGDTFYGELIKDVHDGVYGREQTYLKDEYDELILLATCMKLASPVLAAYAHYLPKTDGKYKETHVLELLRTSVVFTLPAIDRLNLYCGASAATLVKQAHAAICRDIGSAEIPGHFLARAMVRSLIMGSSQNPSRTFVQQMYRALVTESLALSKGVNDKQATRTPQGDKESTAERYRAAQQVPDYTYVTSEEYLMVPEEVVPALNPTGDLEKAKMYINVLSASSDFTIARYHLVLTGLIIRKVIHLMDVTLIRRVAMFHAIAYTAAWMSDHGFQDLANFIMSSRVKKVDNEGWIGGYPFKDFTLDSKEDIAELYPYVRKDRRGRPLNNPAAVMLDGVIEEINAHLYPNDGCIPVNIRNQVIDILKLTADNDV